MVTVLLALGVFYAVVEASATLLDLWEGYEVAGWEFEPMLHREGVPEAYKVVTRAVFVAMILAIVMGICKVMFLVQLLRWKKSGFWGFAITLMITAVANLILALLIKNGYAKIDVETDAIGPYLNIGWSALKVTVVWAVLQIKRDGVSCWKHMSIGDHD